VSHVIVWHQALEQERGLTKLIHPLFFETSLEEKKVSDESGDGIILSWSRIERRARGKGWRVEEWREFCENSVLMASGWYWCAGSSLGEMTNSQPQKLF
jgi:hypothetical protein